MRFNSDDKYEKEYTYDQRGNVHQFSAAAGGTVYTMVYDYDDNGNETGISLTGPGGVGAAQSFLYDAGDRLTQARLDGGVMLMSAATHRPFGPIDSYRVGFEMPMPIVQRIPDERYRLEQLTLSVPGYGIILDRSYSYLDRLNVTGWTDSRNLTLGYDDLLRLTTIRARRNKVNKVREGRLAPAFSLLVPQLFFRARFLGASFLRSTPSSCLRSSSRICWAVAAPRAAAEGWKRGMPSVPCGTLDWWRRRAGR